MTTKELSKLTPEEKRIKIALACDWTWEGPFNKRRKQGNRLVGPSGVCVVWPDWQLGGKLLPDYLNDLNAIHEAEKTLRTAEKQNGHMEHLEKLTGAPDYGSGTYWFVLATATAAQRADAFLLTVG